MGLKLEGSLRVIKANGSDKKIDAAVGIGRYVAQKVVRQLKFEKLTSRQKRGATFATLENNLMSIKMPMDAKTTRSDAFFRFTVVARADVFPTPSAVEQWYQRPNTMCQRYDK
jgi:hypothetical protein